MLRGIGERHYVSLGTVRLPGPPSKGPKCWKRCTDFSGIAHGQACVGYGRLVAREKASLQFDQLLEAPWLRAVDSDKNQR